MKAVIIILGFFLTSCSSAQLKSPFELPHFEANSVNVISDGDAYAQSYLGLELTPYTNKHFRDAITVFQNSKKSEYPASNSVNGTPEIFSLSKNGDFALIVETKKPKLRNERFLKDLRDGNLVTLINLEESKKPQSETLGFTPLSVDIHSNGKWAAIGGLKSGKGMVAVIWIQDKKIIKISEFAVSEIVQTGGNDKNPDVVSLVQWHPTSPLFSIHLFRKNSVAFVRFSEAQGQITQVGNTVETRADPFVGRFTPDGHHYITANWGRNFTAKSIYDRLPQDESSLSLIGVGKNQHIVVQTIETALSPEGISISQDGSLVATVSMQNSLYSVTNEEYENISTVTLFKLEGRKTKRLEKISEAHFEGILPEGGAFDLSGKYFLTSVFQNSETDSTYGVVKVFEIQPGKMDFVGDLTVPHGSHHIVVR